jgi:hypothetical protein
MTTTAISVPMSLLALASPTNEAVGGASIPSETAIAYSPSRYKLNMKARSILACLYTVTGRFREPVIVKHVFPLRRVE